MKKAEPLTEIGSGEQLQALVLDFVKNMGGVCHKALMEDWFAIELAHEFTHADLCPMEGRKKPKWKNSLDWAIVMLGKKRQVATRYDGRGKNRQLIVVATPRRKDGQTWVGWALAGRKQHNFTKTCPACSRRIASSLPACVCGYPFPPRKPRKKTLRYRD